MRGGVGGRPAVYEILAKLRDGELKTGSPLLVLGTVVFADPDLEHADFVAKEGDPV